MTVERDRREQGAPGLDRRASGRPSRRRFVLDARRAALVVTDPQIDFLSPRGAAWGLVSQSVERNGTVENIERLLRAASRANMTIAISPHYYYPTDRGWRFGGPLEVAMRDVGMFDRKRSPVLEGSLRSGADFMPQYTPYMLDDRTIIASAHRMYGPQHNDLVRQLRRHGVAQVVLAGMSANLCVEAHLRELLERGFQVAVVPDATAAAWVREGDGYLAATINFRYLAHALWSTEETVGLISARR
jgi:nicotinamidase-related amidase